MRSISKTFVKTSIVIAAVCANNNTIQEVDRITVETFETVTEKNALKLARETDSKLTEWENSGYTLIVVNKWSEEITYRMSAETFMQYGQIDLPDFID